MKISVETTDFAEVAAAVTESIEHLRANRFPHGHREHHEFADGLERLRDVVLPLLKQRLRDTQILVTFVCTPRHFGSAHLEVTVGGICLQFLDVFFDKFTPGLCTGTASLAIQDEVRFAHNLASRLTVADKGVKLGV